MYEKENYEEKRVPGYHNLCVSKTRGSHPTQIKLFPLNKIENKVQN